MLRGKAMYISARKDFPRCSSCFESCSKSWMMNRESPSARSGMKVIVYPLLNQYAVSIANAPMVSMNIVLKSDILNIFMNS